LRLPRRASRERYTQHSHLGDGNNRPECAPEYRNYFGYGRSKRTPPIVQTTTNTLGDVVDTTQVNHFPGKPQFHPIMDLSAGVVAGVTRADEIGRGSGGWFRRQDNGLG